MSDNRKGETVSSLITPAWEDLPKERQDELRQSFHDFIDQFDIVDGVDMAKTVDPGEISISIRGRWVESE